MGLTLRLARRRRLASHASRKPFPCGTWETVALVRPLGGQSLLALAALALASWGLAAEFGGRLAYAQPPARAASAVPALAEADEAEDDFVRWKRLVVAGRPALDLGMRLHTQAGELLDKRAARLSPEQTKRLFDALVEVDQYVIQKLRASNKFDVALAVQTRLAEWSAKFIAVDSPEAVEARALVDDLAAIQRLPAKSQKTLAGVETLDAEIGPALAAGDVEGAQEAALAALAVRTELLDEDHLDRAASRARMGLALLTAEDFDAAVEELQAALLVYRKRLGEKHPALGDVQVGLADAFAQSERWKEAAPLYAAACATTKAVYGEDSTEYGQRVSQHAWGAWQAKELNLSAKLYNEAVKTLRGALGEESPELIQPLLEFGDLRCEQESYEEALPLFEEAVELSRRTNEHDSVDHAAVVYRVALCHDRLSAFAQAEALYRESLAILDKLDETDVELTGVVLENLGLLYHDMEELERAEPLHRRAWTLLKEHLGEEHADAIASQESLGLTLAGLDRFDEAEPLLLAVVAARKKDPGPESPEYATTLHLLGRQYKEQNQLDKSAELLKEAVAAWKAASGATAPEYASAAFDLGEVKRAQGDARGALPWHRIALDVRREDNGASHEDTVASLSVIGKLLLDRERFSDAEDAFHYALDASEALHGRGSEPTAGLLYSLGRTYRQWGDVGLAILYLEDAAKALDESTERKGREYAAAARELAAAYREVGAAATAKRWLGLADEAANAGVADDPLIAERAEILVERALYGLTFFPPGGTPPSLYPITLTPPAETPIALLDKAAALAKKLAKADLGLDASIAFVRAKDAALSNTPAGALQAAETALEKARAAFGQDHTRVGQALHLVALAQLRLGDGSDAEAPLLEATTIVVERLGAESLAYAETVEPLATLWRKQGRFDDAFPLTVAAWKARYQSAASNLPHLADLGLQKLYLDRCLNAGRSPTPAEINVLKPNDPSVAAECARWAIVLASLDGQFIGNGNLIPFDENLQNQRLTVLVRRRGVTTVLARCRVGVMEEVRSWDRFDKFAADFPESLLRSVDESHPVRAAFELSALRKAIGPESVAVYAATVLASLADEDKDKPSRRAVAWIIPGDAARPVAFVDLGPAAESEASSTLDDGGAREAVEKRSLQENTDVAKRVIAKLQAEPVAAGAKSLYICGLRVSPQGWLAAATVDLDVRRTTDLSQLVNDASSLPDPSGTTRGRDDGSAFNPATKNKVPHDVPPSELRRPEADETLTPNAALPRSPASKDKAQTPRDDTQKLPLPGTNNGRPQPTPTGN